MSELVLGVLYDRGTAGPAEITSAIRPFAEVVMLVPHSEHTARVAPMLEALGCAIHPITEPAPDELPPLDGVVTFSESRLALTADLARRLGLAGHSEATVTALADKGEQRRMLAAAGVDGTPAAVARDAGDLTAALAVTGVPAIIKPRSGEGSAFTVRADSDAAALDAARAFWAARPGAALVVEALLRGRSCGEFGDYVSVEIASLQGEHTALAVTGKLPLAEPFRETGQFWPAALPGDERAEIAALAIRAASALGVTDGVSHVEVKLTTAGPRLIEVNGRLGGNLNDLGLRTGKGNLIGVAGRIALGQPPVWHDAEPRVTCYQHYHLAPLWAATLVAVHGVADVRRLPFIDGYRPLLSAGTRLRSDSATEPLDILCGTADGPAEMLVQLAIARRLLRFEFGDRNGTTVTLPATDLPAESRPR